MALFEEGTCGGEAAEAGADDDGVVLVVAEALVLLRLATIVVASISSASPRRLRFTPTSCRKRARLTIRVPARDAHPRCRVSAGASIMPKHYKGTQPRRRLRLPVRVRGSGV